MRISDWSSDVCSSDLVRRLAHLGVAHVDGLTGVDVEEHHLGALVFLLQAALEHVVHGEVGRLGIVHEDEGQLENYGAREDARGIAVAGPDDRSEERRVGKESVSTCRSWWSPLHEKKNRKEQC